MARSWPPRKQRRFECLLNGGSLQVKTLEVALLAKLAKFFEVL